MRRSWLRVGVALTTVVVAQATAAAPATATTLVVDDHEGTASECAGASYASIQAALDVAGAGDTVEVCPGTYIEDLTITTPGLRLVSRGGAAQTTIRGRASQHQSGFPDVSASTNIAIRAGGVTVEGFAIESPDMPEGHYSSGMVLTGSDITIRNNAFKVARQGSTAVQTYRPSDGGRSVDGLSITGNRFDGAVGTGEGYYGIYVNDQADPPAGRRVAITGNTLAGGLLQGISVERDRVDVTGSRISPEDDSRRDAGAIVVTSSHDGAVSDVDVADNRIGPIDLGGFHDLWGGFAVSIRLGSPGTGGSNDVTLSGITVQRNDMGNPGVGVHVYDSAGGVTVRRNALARGWTTGVVNESPAVLDAACNWWGHPDGPSAELGRGRVAVRGNVDFRPWYAFPSLYQPCPPVVGDKPAVVRGTRWYLLNELPRTDAVADRVLACGPGGVPFMGDWDGNGSTTPGWYRNGVWALSNANTGSGCPQITFRFGSGRVGDRPVVGDWNGDGIDDVGLVRVIRGRATWLLETDVIRRHTTSDGRHNIAFTYGSVHLGDRPMVGDWNGDGIDDAGLIRPTRGLMWLLETDTAGGHATSDGRHNIAFAYGSTHHLPVVGDWESDGIDNPGLIDGSNTWLLEDQVTDGHTDSNGTHNRTFVFQFGSRQSGDRFLTWR